MPRICGVEVPPDEFRQPGHRAGATRLKRPCVRVRRKLAHRDGAEAQVHRQVRRPFHCRKVPRLGVVVDPSLEVGEERRAAAHAAGARPAARGSSARSPSPRATASPGRAREAAAPAPPPGTSRVRAQMRRRERLQPCIPVRREHRERLAGERQHLVALEDHLVLGRHERDAAPGELVRHRGVAVHRRRLVVVIGEDRVDFECRRERRNLFARPRMADDQATAVRAQCGVELAHAFPDELYATVLRRRRCVEDFAVEDERGVDGLSRAECARQRGVIEVAQVPPEPDQCATEGRRGGHAGHSSSVSAAAAGAAVAAGVVPGAASGAGLRRGIRRSRARISWRQSRAPVAS